MGTPMGQWLVRTAKNVISGPYDKEALCQMILSGELGSQDEVCESGSYWIFLHEREEVALQLGIHLPKAPKNSDEETTETQTQTQTQTDAGINSERTPVPMSVTAAEDEPTEISVATEAGADGNDGATQVLGSRLRPAESALAQAQPEPVAETSSNGTEDAALPAADAAKNPAGQPAAPKVVYRPMVLGEIERPSAWRMAIWILVVAAFFLAFWMLRALKH